MENNYIKDIKTFIEEGDLDSIKDILKDIINMLKTKEYRINYEYIWQKCYLHCCLKKKTNIKDFFDEIYKSFDDVTKIALKPTMIYAKYL